MERDEHGRFVPGNSYRYHRDEMVKERYLAHQTEEEYEAWQTRMRWPNVVLYVVTILAVGGLSALAMILQQMARQ